MTIRLKKSAKQKGREEMKAASVHEDAQAIIDSVAGAREALNSAIAQIERADLDDAWGLVDQAMEDLREVRGKLEPLAGRLAVTAHARAEGITGAFAVVPREWKKASPVRLVSLGRFILSEHRPVPVAVDEIKINGRVRLRMGGAFYTVTQRFVGGLS